MKNTAILAVGLALALAAGCRTGEPALGSGSSTSFGTIVFRSELETAITNTQKAAFVKSRALWDETTHVLRFSVLRNNYWTFEPASNQNLLLPGQETALVNLYETMYGPIAPAQED